ncbi:bacteriophage spanin2 family protein [Actinokineospora guangxiensis]|uniref:Bacteriophage spanin2 family protein n=1 Tax=Actinokineospora guangxiensis TaxID=1490288 RepID=A0ABW0EWQ6_9PSEU
MRSRIATTLTAAALLGALTACSEIQEAANTAGNVADKAGVCVKALELAGFTPDTSNPDQAVEEAQQKADELNTLAQDVGDTTLSEALTGMADQLREIPANLDPQNLADWTQQKLDAFNTLSQACL